MGLLDELKALETKQLIERVQSHADALTRAKEMERAWLQEVKVMVASIPAECLPPDHVIHQPAALKEDLQYHETAVRFGREILAERVTYDAWQKAVQPFLILAKPPAA